MFHLYTIEARRVIFFARHEASIWGADLIDCEHLLLGLIRESPGVFEPLGLDASTVRSTLIEPWARPVEKTDPARELPLSDAAKRVLSKEDLERGTTQWTGPHHLRLGLLHESESPAARVLMAQGISLEQAREKLKGLDRRLQAPEGPRSTLDWDSRMATVEATLKSLHQASRNLGSRVSGSTGALARATRPANLALALAVLAIVAVLLLALWQQ